MFKRSWWIDSWSDRMQEMWTGAANKFATVTGLIGILFGIIGVVADLQALAGA